MKKNIFYIAIAFALYILPSCTNQIKHEFASLYCTNSTSGDITITTLYCDCALLLHTGENGKFDITAESYDYIIQKGIVYYKIYSAYLKKSTEKRKSVAENSNIDDNITNFDF